MLKCIIFRTFRKMMMLYSGKMFFLAEIGSLTGFIFFVMFLKEIVSHYSFWL